MPAIHVRPATASDIPFLMELDHSYTTDYVWQLDLRLEPDRIGVNFRRMRLPRSVRHEYPREIRRLADEWTHYSGLLVSTLDGKPIGYVGLMSGVIPETTLATDLVVARRLRRQGIGSALLLAAEEWAQHHQSRQILLVVQSKNHPAINLAQKRGYDYCGYSDRYYANQDIALLFAKTLR